jgi:hypothetical protein
VTALPDSTRPQGASPQLPERLAPVTLAATPAEASRARRWLDDLTAGALDVGLDEYELVAVVNILFVGGWSAFLADEHAGRRPWLDDEDFDSPEGVGGHRDVDAESMGGLR